MTKWVCHNCGSTNDIKERICQGSGKKKNDPNSVGGKCYHKRVPLDKVLGDEKKEYDFSDEKKEDD